MGPDIVAEEKAKAANEPTVEFVSVGDGYEMVSSDWGAGGEKASRVSLDDDVAKSGDRSGHGVVASCSCDAAPMSTEVLPFVQLDSLFNWPKAVGDSWRISCNPLGLVVDVPISIPLASPTSHIKSPVA